MEDVAPAETVAPGSTHICEFVNEINRMGMAMAHPIRVHGTQFRVLSRTGGAANTLRKGINDAGWIRESPDTLRVMDGRHRGAPLELCRRHDHCNHRTSVVWDPRE